MGRRTRSADEKFLENVCELGADDCWPWTGGTDPFGYGRFYAEHKEWRAHSYALRQTGVDVAGAHVHHTCFNKGCCNPRHLLALTPSQHRLMHRKDLFKCKHGHPWTKETTKWRFRSNAIYPNRECKPCRRIGLGHNPYPPSRAERETQARSRIIMSLQECAAEDGMTPLAVDFNPPMALRRLQPEKAARWKERGWPAQSSIAHYFGSWRSAVVAAGLEPRRVGERTIDRRWANMPLPR